MVLTLERSLEPVLLVLDDPVLLLDALAVDVLTPEASLPPQLMDVDY